MPMDGILLPMKVPSCHLLMIIYIRFMDKECQASDDFKKEVHIPRKRQRLEISTNRLIDGERKLNFNVVNAYMKNYKTAKKAKETESEKRSRQEK